MRKALNVTACTALLLAVAASAALAQDEIDWKKDYEEALKAGKEEGKPVVLHFYTDF